MPKSLILRASGLITDTSAPLFPDIATGIILDIDPAKIAGVVSGNSIPAITVSGEGTERERTFSEIFSASWARPKWQAGTGPNGHAALRFEGSHMIHNSPPSNLPPVRHQPNTYIWVGRLLAGGSEGMVSRIVARGFVGTGATDFGYQYIAVDTDGKIQIATQDWNSSGAVIRNFTGPVPASLGAWRVVVAVFNGGASMLADGTSITTGTLGNGAHTGSVIGVRNSGDAAGLGLRADCLRYQEFNRAFTRAEVEEAVAAMQEAYL